MSSATPKLVPMSLSFAPAGRYQRQLARGGCVIALMLVLGFLPVSRGNLDAAAGPGDSWSAPVPLGAEENAGPWRLHIVDVVIGSEAGDQVAAASPINDPIRDGSTYILVRVSAQNMSDRSLPLSGNDFALLGTTGVVHRFVGAVPPDPALDVQVDAGATAEGWIVFGAPSDETGLVLLYDSLTLPGNWADRSFALDDQPTTPRSEEPPPSPNDAGVDPGAPAGISEPVATADWRIELLQVARGEEVFNLSDYRTQALTIADSTDETVWLALRLSVTNVHPPGPAAPAAFLPPGAFMLTDETGTPVLDVATLTPPEPAASGAYEPGASREGWVAFELPAGYTASMVQFLPYAMARDADPRYLTFG